jgi:hypothetical protein
VFTYAAEFFSISASGPVMNIGRGVIPVWRSPNRQLIWIGIESERKKSPECRIQGILVGSERLQPLVEVLSDQI